MNKLKLELESTKKHTRGNMEIKGLGLIADKNNEYMT